MPPRNRRMLGAAAVAAALWLVSGLVHVAFASNVYVDRLLRLGIPTPTMAQFWSWPFPWSILTLLLAVISVAAVFLVMLNLVTRKPRTGPAFASAWFAVIVAGVVTGLAIDAIVLMSSVQAVGSRALATASIEYAIIGAYWGFVQGWIPALIASREVKEDDAQAPPRRREFAAIAVLALAALIIAGMFGAAAHRSAMAEARASIAAGSSWMLPGNQLSLRSTAGTVTTTWVPAPSFEVSAMSPPAALSISREMKRPSPDP